MLEWSEIQGEIAEKYYNINMCVLEKLFGAYLCYVEPLEMMKKSQNVPK